MVDEPRPENKAFISTLVSFRPPLYSVQITYWMNAVGIDLSKVGERERLKARREPYWQRLYVGCYIGFRPSKAGGAGTWIARARDADAGEYHFKSLGDFGHLLPNERFVIAKREAEKFTAIVEAGGEVRRNTVTVADACEDLGPKLMGRRH